jgi:hypothetical protein
MQYESHERARFLLDRAVTEGISLDEQRWLNGHTAECAECSRYDELSRRAIRALDSFAFELDPAAALRVENAIRSRAERLALAEMHGRRFWAGPVVAIFLTIAGSMAMWQAAGWLAGRTVESAGSLVGDGVCRVLACAVRRVRRAALLVQETHGRRLRRRRRDGMTARSAFHLVPKAAKILAAMAFLASVIFFFCFFDEHKAIGLGTAIGVGIGTFAAAFILLAGYVHGDSRRRGMPPLVWTALTLLIPNGVGFVLYFLLRRPIVHPCSNCGRGIAQDAVFCSRCGHAQLNAGVQHSRREA